MDRTGGLVRDTVTPEVLHTVADLRDRVASHGVAGRTRHLDRVVLVPTMGALHAGHLALAARALELGDRVVVSIFVNPLQFGPEEDLDAYPRTLRDDVARLGELGVPYVFAPTAREMYPDLPVGTRVTAGPVASRYEGASRPGHFDGVLTVVTKLLNIVQPDVVVFGQKDAQQVFLVQRMVADLNLPVSVEVVPTVRDEQGLALSSRNRYLDAAQRRGARALSAALRAAASAAGGVVGAIAAAQAVIDAEPLAKLDYLVVVHPQTFLPVGDDHHGTARMLVAAMVGTTRLIDNAPLEIS
jgi:pantoate--beta-alanine ligase